MTTAFKMPPETHNADGEERLAGLVVPFEVTTPPVPLGELSRVEELRAALAAREALGTVLAHLLGPEALAGVPEEEPLSPRPTFHYRLPNCRIDEPEWTVAEEWNRWIEVERLAARPRELARRCAAAAAAKQRLWRRLKERVRRALSRERR